MGEEFWRCERDLNLCPRGLPERAEVRVARLMADRNRWGCALRDGHGNEAGKDKSMIFRSKAKGINIPANCTNSFLSS